MLQKVVQMQRSGNPGNSVPAALLARGDGNALPMRQPALGLPGVELDYGALRQHGDDPGDAQLCRLLYDPVHALTTRDSLGQYQRERRLAVRCGMLADPDDRGPLAQALDAGSMLTASAVE